MYRLSLIISEIYNKYLPLAQKDGISLNLDFSDTTKEISNPEQIKKYLDENLSSTLKRSDKGDVTINVNSSAIIITDTGTTLSKAACALLSNRYIDVASRVGFGTTVKIFFKPQENTATPTQAAIKEPTQIEGVGLSLEVNNTEPEPILESTGKLAVKKGKHRTRLSTKLRLQRRDNIDAAAKKANKEVKRIAKKAQKIKRKTRKTATTKTSKPATKKPLHTPKAPKLAKKATKSKKTTRKFEIS